MHAAGYKVAPEDIARFEENGVVLLRGVLEAPALASLAQGIGEVVARLPSSATGYDVSELRQRVFDEAGEAEASGEAKQYNLSRLGTLLRASNARPLLDPVEDAQAKGHFKLDTTTWRRNAKIRALALDSILPGIAAQLLSATKVNYCDDQVFVKDPHTADRTAFHQDYTYFNMQGWKGCVMWVCVDPAGEAAGVPVYVKGSHLWGREFRPNLFLAQTAFPGSEGDDLPDIEGHLDQYELLHFAVEPGDVLIHHFRTVHGAGGNRSHRPRRAVSLRYCGEDMRFYKRPGTPPQPYHDHDLQDGDPLDSRSFPVVWPRPWPEFRIAPFYDAAEIEPRLKIPAE